MALCLARSASANPPAKLGVGVFRPLSFPLLLLRLIPESRGAGGGAGFLPAAGLLAGGAGGLGFPRAAVPFTPLVLGAAGGGGGVGRTIGAGAGLTISSFK